MAYGDSGVTTDRSDGSTAWTSFAGVWHLKDGTTLDLSDAKGSLGMTNSSATAGAGKINGGIATSGSSQYASKANCGFSLKPVSGNSYALTMSFWMYRGGNQSWAGPVGYANETYGYTVRFNGTTGKIRLAVQNTVLEYGTALSQSTWYHVTVGFSTAGMKIYINGAEVASNTTNSNPQNIWDGQALWVGKVQSDGVNWQGVVDELRVSLSARSADWILAEYNNQNSPSTFYTVGAESGSSGARRRAIIAFVPMFRRGS
jgi:hypothetical protein